MPDLVVTVPKSFGLTEWIAEGDPAPSSGDPAGEPWSGENWVFSVAGPPPPIEPGERVYIVHAGKLRGYAPLIELSWYGKDYDRPRPRWGKWGLVRGGGAVAVTIPERIVGFMGWRKRWWERTIEVPFPEWRSP